MVTSTSAGGSRDPPLPIDAAEVDVVTIVATGLTSGVGLETLKQLVARGQDDKSGAQTFRIIIGARTAPSNSQVESDILVLRASPKTTVEYLSLDLSSPASVDAFPSSVKALLQPNSPAGNGLIDILLLCAGATVPVYRNVTIPHSGKEVEETLYVNVISQARLAARLLPIVSPTARISIVNSDMHRRASKRTSSSSLGDSMELNILVSLLGYPGLSPSTIGVELSPPKWASLKAYEISKLVEMHFAFVLKDKIEVRLTLSFCMRSLMLGLDLAPAIS